MSQSVIFKTSKELQIKLRPELATTHKRAKETIQEMLKWLENHTDLKWKDKSGDNWERRGERYDTKDNFFKTNQITLATEKSKDDKNRTKLKCKLHNFIPELLYQNEKKAFCYPANGGMDNIELKFKTEQDIHFNNCKYCATGYMKFPRTNYSFALVNDFFPYYPNLKKLPNINGAAKLVKVKDWHEQIYDNIKMKIDDYELKGALVTRRNYSDGSLDESEFSFKISEGEKGWNYKGLTALAEIYNLLRTRYGNIFLINQPSIFTFHNPVSSLEIIDICKKQCEDS